MDIELEIKITNLAETLEHVSERILAERLSAAMVEATDYLKVLVVAGTPLDTGGTAGRIFTQINGTGINLSGIVASPDKHFYNLEYGRQPGAKMPPEEPIRLWAERHGIEGKSAVYLIRRAISRRGIAPLHIMQRAAEHTSEVYSIFEKHFNGLQ